jgi:hypothetical protein
MAESSEPESIIIHQTILQSVFQYLNELFYHINNLNTIIVIIVFKLIGNKCAKI